MLRLSLRTRLIFSFLALAFLIVPVGASSLAMMYRMREAQRSLIHETTPSIRELGEIRAAAMRMLEAFVTLKLEQALRGDVDELGESVERRISYRQLERALKAYSQRAESLPGEYPLIAEIAMLCRQLSVWTEAITPAPPDIPAPPPWPQRQQDLERLEDRLDSILDLAIELEAFSVSEKVSLFDSTLERSWSFFLGGVLLVMVSAFVLALKLSEYFSSPVRSLAEGAATIGSGNLDVRIPKRSNDELGELTDRFNTMAEKLKSSTVSRSFLDTILNSMTDAVIVMDGESRIVSSNSAAARLIEYQPGELIGLRFEDLAGEPFPGESAASRPAVEHFFRARGGREIPVALAIAPLTLSPSSGGWVCVARDITEAKEAAAELDLYRERLVVAEQLNSLSSLGAIMAHRFNQPLTAARLFMQQALRGHNTGSSGVEESIRDGLEVITELSNAVKEMLQQTRIESPSERREVNLAEVLKRCRRLLQERARRARLTINLVDLEDLPTVRGIELELHEAFYIIMQNAIQACPPDVNGTLNISGNEGNCVVELRFEDSCGGISPEHLPKLFDLFFTTKSASQGMGIGLCIAKRILTRMGGQISVESEVGKGSTFTIQLPRSDGQQDS